VSGEAIVRIRYGEWRAGAAGPSRSPGTACAGLRAATADRPILSMGWWCYGPDDDKTRSEQPPPASARSQPTSRGWTWSLLAA
jgi:hypothetical protein